MFKNIPLPLSINTSSDDPNKVFFDPVLAGASTYDVGVGYFTTGWIRDTAHGIARFAGSKGKARWVVGHELQKDDVDSILNASKIADKEFNAKRIFEDRIDEIFSILKDETRLALAWLIRDGIVDIRVAVPINKLKGIYHAKNGVFSDKNGNLIAFSGSYNLTAKAATNWEAIEIFRSWASEESLERCKLKQREFETIWNNRDENLLVFEPTNKTLDKIKEYSSNGARPYSYEMSRPPIPKVILNKKDKLRDYQERAISSWFSHNGRGLFCMATGSGKTITALSAATRLLDFVRGEDSNLVIVVTVPFLHLGEQWCEEASKFGYEPIKCYDGTDKWLSDLQTSYNQLLTGDREYLLAVAVNASFSNRQFQSFLAGVTTNLLLISDEVHNMGAEDLVKKLPANAKFRIGLSATPVRHNDPFGTKSLFDYYGESVIDFGIKDAIKAGYLCKYNYYPVICELDDDELEEYIALSKKIARMMAIGGEDEYSNNLKLLLIKRAKLTGSSKDKKRKLKELLLDSLDRKHSLIYSSEAIIDGVKDIDRVVYCAGRECQWKVEKFTAGENRIKRKEILRKFSDGEIDAVVAIKCLDEGVDIPQTKTAYILSSSTNPRQFIQRRGRVLRKAKNKKLATIYDFIAIPPLDRLGQDSDTFRIEKRMIERELERVNEFAEIAENFGEALSLLRPIRKKLNLLGA